MRRYSARVGDLGGLERLAALQSEIEAKKLSEPGALERTFGVGAGIVNSVMNFRKGQEVLKAQAAEKEAERERRGQEFIIREGLEELPQGAEIPAGAKVHEYAGKRWVKRPSDKEPPLAEYTDTTLVQLGDGTWAKQRNIYNRRTKETTKYIVPVEGKPQQAILREQRIEEDVGKLTDTEKAQYANLMAKYKQVGYDAISKEYDEAKRAKWLAFLTTKDASPRVLQIIRAGTAPIADDYGSGDHPVWE